MATLVLSAVGTAIGGPIGSAVGAFIGGQIDGAIFGGGTREGPRLKELAVTTSSYGQPLPRHFGRMRVPGSIIWSTELIETTRKEGGGKGRPSTRTYSYSVSFAVALSSTPLDRIGRIWADGNLLRGANGDLKVEGALRVYTGYGDAPVDPLIAADRGGDAPAFRDCAYVVFEDLQLAEFGNRIPALTFEVFAPQDAAVALSQLVPQSARAQTDTFLPDARGFSDEGGSIGGSLAVIDRVFPLSCVTGEEGLELASDFALPSDVPVVAERLSDSANTDADRSRTTRENASKREPLALRYYDEQRDYQPGVQRAVGPRANGRELILDLPAAMTATGARRLANHNANRSRYRLERIDWLTGQIDPAIRAGSIVTVPDRAGFWRVRSWEWHEIGVELELERLPPDLEPAALGDPGIANPPPDRTVSATILSAFEVPPAESDDPHRKGVIAAATSAGKGWRGATLFSRASRAV